MPAPVYVGAGPAVYGGTTNTDGWASSLTLSAGDLPSGIATGDRLLLYIAAGMAGSVAAFDHWAVAGMTLVDVAPTTALRMWLFTATYTGSWSTITVRPETVSNTLFTPGTPASSAWRMQAIAYRPDHAIGDVEVGGAASGSLTPSGTVTAAAEGAIVTAAICTRASSSRYGADMGAFTSPASFTEQVRQAAVTTPERLGGLVVADRHLASAGGPYSVPQWSVPALHRSVQISVMLDGPFTPTPSRRRGYRGIGLVRGSRG